MKNEKYTTAYNVPLMFFLMKKEYEVINNTAKRPNRVAQFLEREGMQYYATGATNLRVKRSEGEIVELWAASDAGVHGMGVSFNLEYGPCPACGEEIANQCMCSDDARSGRTRVIYRVDKETGETIAVMPEIDSGAGLSTGVQVYAKSYIAGVSPEWVMQKTRRASPSEIERSGLIDMMEHDGYVLRRITYAQLLSDDCNGGIGPSKPEQGLYDVGCGWACYSFNEKHTNAQARIKATLIAQYGKKA